MVTASTWNKIKRDYINGTESYRQLAAKYDVQLRVIARQAKKEEWVRLRQEQRAKMSTKLQQKIDEAWVDEGIKVMTQAKDLVVKELNVIAGYLDNDDIDPSVTESITRSTERVVKMLRDMFDVPTPEQAESRRIAAERLNLDIKKAEQDTEKDNTITVKFDAGQEEWNE